jgi:hypothetical protein
VARQVEEDDMKYAKCILIIVPLFVLAQEADMKVLKAEQYDWALSDVTGIVLAVTPDSINFDEQWLRILPTGLSIASDDAMPRSYAQLRTPFQARVSYFKSGSRLYVTSMRFIKQLAYNSRGEIVDAK